MPRTTPPVKFSVPHTCAGIAGRAVREPDQADLAAQTQA